MRSDTNFQISGPLVPDPCNKVSSDARELYSVERVRSGARLLKIETRPNGGQFVWWWLCGALPSFLCPNQISGGLPA